MNATSQKQAGDLVTITAGVNKDKAGILQEKAGKGWNIKLRSGEVVLTSFPFIKLISKKGEFEDTDPWKSILAGEVAEDQGTPTTEPEIDGSCEITQYAPESPGTASRETSDEIVTPGEDIAQAPTGAEGNGGIEENTEISENLTKMTTLQLRGLAKRKGVSVARTKADFLRIIKEKHPDEDLERLKGKVLFDRVSELHISRLRSKEDLQKLLLQ